MRGHIPFMVSRLPAVAALHMEPFMFYSSNPTSMVEMSNKLCVVPRVVPVAASYLNLNLNIFIAPCTNKYTSEKHAIK